ncbi:MAG TPA: GTPase Era [Anaerolineales bacterium]|nr:GTPase Era [Anaerolineales bacterium]
MKTGNIAIIGKPNVGKSTLINALVGQKIASVTHKAQTTRKRQLGILTTDDYQLVFFDTPGIHLPHHKLGEFLNQEAEKALDGVDLALWLVDSTSAPGPEDAAIASKLKIIKGRPEIFLVLNKIDLTDEQPIDFENEYRDLFDFGEIHQISATQGAGVKNLLQAIINQMPEGIPEFDPEMVTDLYERELAAELIRESCLLNLRSEVPHGINIRIDEFTERGETGARIHATIFVERDSQKGIVIGQNGSMLKQIGIAARQQIEEMSDRKVFLELRVKVEKNWRDNEEVLSHFGYKIEKPKKKKK